MDTKERNEEMFKRRKESYDVDFLPRHTPEATPNAEHRLANAAEYAAYQLGQINRNLARLVDHLTKDAK